MHTLRCSPCFGNEALEQFDSLLRSGLCTITNLAISHPQWIQPSLPVSAGDLGTRRVVSLAPPAFLASAASSDSLQSLLLLNCHRRLTIDSHQERLMRSSITVNNTHTPGSSGDTKKSVWDRPGIIADQAVVTSAFTDNFHRAWLLAASALHMSTCGLRLDNEAVRVAVSLRLGTTHCEPHQCPFGKQVDARGSCGLSYKRGTGRSIRHHELNDIIYRTLIRASTPSVLKPPALSRTDGKRPDQLTLIPWQRGKSVT